MSRSVLYRLGSLALAILVGYAIGVAQRYLNTPLDNSSKRVAAKQNVAEEFPSWQDANDVFRSFPMNLDQQCFGISLVGELAIEQRSMASDPPDAEHSPAEFSTDAAVRILSSLEKGQRPILPSKVRGREEDGDRILSGAAALTKIAREITARYASQVESFSASSRNDDLNRVVWQCLLTKEELEERIDADADSTIAIGCIGTRTLASGESREMMHAVILRWAKGESPVLFDSNTPGVPVGCVIHDDPQGAVIEWASTFRDTNSISVQKCRIVLLNDYIIALRIEDAK